MSEVKIKSFLRTNRELHFEILTAIGELGLTQNELYFICSQAGMKIRKGSLSEYIKRGGNGTNAPTDQQLIFLCGMLGIELNFNVVRKKLTKHFVRKHYDTWFPEKLFPEFAKTPKAVIRMFPMLTET